MKRDPGSSYTVAEALTALSRTAETYYSTAIDHALAPSGEHFVSCGAFATSFVATLQHSPDNSVFTDEADTTLGNTVSLTLTDVGSGRIKCPNPRARYTRLKLVLGGTCVSSVTSVLGPLNHVAAS